MFDSLECHCSGNCAELRAAQKERDEKLREHARITRLIDAKSLLEANGYEVTATESATPLALPDVIVPISMREASRRSRSGIFLRS